MKGCFSAILVTILASLLFGFLGKSRHQDRVERLLSDRLAIVEQTHPAIDISYDYFTAKISGKATQKELDILRKSVDELRLGNGRVTYEVETPESRKKPGAFLVALEGDRVLLRGTVDSAQTRKDFEQLVRIDGLAVENQLRVSDAVAPLPSFLSAASAIPLLFRSAEGARIEALPDRIEVAGLLPDEELKRLVLSFFTPEKWNGAEIVDRLRTVPPPPPPPPPATPPTFTWHQVAPDRAVLEGTVSSSEVRESLVSAVRAFAGPKATVEDRDLKVGTNTRDAGWLTAFPGFASGPLKKVKNPKIAVGPADSRFTGAVSSEAEKVEVALAFLKLNPPSLIVDLEVVPPRRTRPPHIELTGEGGRIDVRGVLPSREARDAIVDAVRGIRVSDDDLLVATNVRDEKWVSSLPGFILDFYGAAIKNREMSLRDGTLVLEGEVTGETTKRMLLSRADSLKKSGIRSVDASKLTVAAPPPPPKPEPKPEPMTVARAEPSAASGKPEESKTPPPPPERPKPEPKPMTVRAAPAPEQIPDPGPPLLAGTPTRPKPAPHPASPKVEEPKQAKGPKKAPPEKPVPREERPPDRAPEVSERFRVFFGTGEYHIRETEKPNVEKILERARKTKGRIEIDGFADQRGDPETNQFLSDQRAARLRLFLIENGIRESRITSVTGRGESPGYRYPEHRRTEVRILD